MDLSELQLKTRTLIAEGQLRQAIKGLIENVKPEEYHNPLILQLAKMQSAKTAALEGRIDHQEEQKQLNQIRSFVLNTVDQLKEKDLRQPGNHQNQQSVTDVFEQSIARITVIWVLFQDQYLETGLSIKEVYAFSKLEKRKYIVQVLNELQNTGRIEKYKKNSVIYWKLTSSGSVLAKKVLESVIFDFPKKE